MILKPVSRTTRTGLPSLKPIYGLVLSVFAMCEAKARDEDTSAVTTVAQVEFDNRFFLNNDGAGTAPDLSRFKRGNIVAPGAYNVDLYVNQDWVSRVTLPFRDDGKGRSAQPCFDRKALQLIGVDFGKLPAEAVEKVTQEDACWRIDEVIATAVSSFDFGDQRLDLSIPQAFLARTARGYVNPEFWDAGVNAAMLGYDANVYRYDTNGYGSRTQGYLGIKSGVNIGKWHFRHDGSHTWSQQGQNKYQNISTYVQRDLPTLSSQLTLGEAYTSGELFDSTPYRGVRLATDDRMLPESLRGYAPVVRGIAKTNAKVTIKQNGTTLLETTVAPGAFEIDDLYATGYGGDLNVEVLEADGSVHAFKVPYAAVPLSLRPGVNRYSFAAGTVRDSSISGNPWFAQGTWQRGVTNLLTGYTGVTVSAGYAAAMAGGAFNTPVGAVGADITQSVMDLPSQQGRMTGSSMRVSYAKNLPQTGTNIAIAAYRYSTGGYFGLNEAVRARSNAEQNLTLDSVWRQRNRASVTVGQSLGDKRGQLYLTASTANYWNRSGSDVNYSVGYSNSIKNIGYSIQATRQRSANGTMDTLYYASVTIPLGKTRPATISSNLTYESNGRTLAQTALSGSLGVDNNVSYGVTASQSGGGNAQSTTSGSANMTYRSSLAEVSGSVGAGRGYSQASVGLRGAIVAHSGGVTLAQPLSETIGIIEAQDAEGTRVLNASGVRIDGRGYAVVPYLTPYSMNAVELDPKGTSTDVELQTTSQQIAPRAGAVVFMRFETVSGRAVLIHAPKQDGTPLPFGALVFNSAGDEVGVVGQASKILVRGVDDQDTLNVKHAGTDKTLCRIEYALAPRDGKRSGADYERLSATCR